MEDIMKYELVQEHSTTRTITADTMADAINAALHYYKDSMPAVLMATPDRAFSPCAYVKMPAVAAAWETYNNTLCAHCDCEDISPDAWAELEAEQDRILSEAIDKATVWTWSMVDHKTVQDSGGWWTDYTLWSYGPERYYAVLGDRDIYNPWEDIFFEDEESHTPYSDWDGENEREAVEWFDCYPVYDTDDVLC